VNKKFIKILESTINRYTRGGFLVGDIVKFKDGYDRMTSFKALNDEIQRRLVMYANSDLPIRITNIKNHYPSTQPGNDDNMDGLVSCDISQEVMPGKVYEYVTCPADLLQRIDAYPNLTPVAGSHHYDNKENIKPITVAEYEEDEQEIVKNQTRKTSQNPEIGSATAPSQTNLLNTQVKIPHGSDTGKLADQGGTKSYTSIYMGLRR
jgi:hypothetical protein